MRGLSEADRRRQADDEKHKAVPRFWKKEHVRDGRIQDLEVIGFPPELHVPGEHFDGVSTSGREERELVEGDDRLVVRSHDFSLFEDFLMQLLGAIVGHVRRISRDKEAHFDKGLVLFLFVALF